MRPSPGSVAAATRVDEASGARQEVGFVGDDERLFVSLHLPLADAEAGVVLCSPVASEFERNYRRETRLAWGLAARGIAACRFHYRGAGHSDGDPSQMSLETMVEDAVRATDGLRDRTGVSRVAFVGTRLACFVAASAARRERGAPLALWEPVLRGDQYFREVFRAGFMSDLRAGDGDAPSREAVVDRLRSEGWVDVLGHTVGWPLYAGSQDRSLDADLGGEPRPLLIVQLSHTRKVRGPYQGLAEDLRRRGFPVDLRVIDEVEPWWFAGDGQGKTALAQATLDWLADRLTPGVAA